MFRKSLVTGVGALAVAAALYLATTPTARADDQTVSWSLPTTSSVTVDTGDTVTWTWADSLPHTVTSLSGPESFNSGQRTGSGQTFAVTFTQAGTYTYQCNVHPGSMTGTVVVQAAATATATATQPAAPATATQPAATATATQPGATATATQPTGATPGAPATGSGLGGGDGYSALVASLLIGALLVLGGGAAAIAASRRA